MKEKKWTIWRQNRERKSSFSATVILFCQLWKSYRRRWKWRRMSSLSLTSVCWHLRQGIEIAIYAASHINEWFMMRACDVASQSKGEHISELMHESGSAYNTLSLYCCIDDYTDNFFYSFLGSFTRLRHILSGFKLILSRSQCEDFRHHQFIKEVKEVWLHFLFHLYFLDVSLGFQ